MNNFNISRAESNCGLSYSAVVSGLSSKRSGHQAFNLITRVQIPSTLYCYAGIRRAGRSMSSPLPKTHHTAIADKISKEIEPGIADRIRKEFEPEFADGFCITNHSGLRIKSATKPILIGRSHDKCGVLAGAWHARNRQGIYWIHEKIYRHRIWCCRSVVRTTRCQREDQGFKSPQHRQWERSFKGRTPVCDIENTGSIPVLSPIVHERAVTNTIERPARPVDHVYRQHPRQEARGMCSSPAITDL